MKKDSKIFKKEYLLKKRVLKRYGLSMRNITNYNFATIEILLKIKRKTLTTLTTPEKITAFYHDVVFSLAEDPGDYYAMVNPKREEKVVKELDTILNKRRKR